MTFTSSGSVQLKVLRSWALAFNLRHFRNIKKSKPESDGDHRRCCFTRRSSLPRSRPTTSKSIRHPLLFWQEFKRRRDQLDSVRKASFEQEADLARPRPQLAIVAVPPQSLAIQAAVTSLGESDVSGSVLACMVGSSTALTSPRTPLRSEDLSVLMPQTSRPLAPGAFACHTRSNFAVGNRSQYIDGYIIKRATMTITI